MTLHFNIVLTWTDTESSAGYTITGPDGTNVHKGSEDRSYDIFVQDRPSIRHSVEDGIETARCTGEDVDVLAAANAADKIGTWKVTVDCGTGSAEDDLEAICIPCQELLHGCSTCGNPIAFRSGRKLQPQTLFSYPVKGTSITFTIYYDSARAHLDGDLGYGWTHSYNIWMEVLKEPNGLIPGSIILHLGSSDLSILKFDEDDYDCSRDDVYVDDITEDSVDKLRVRVGWTAYVFEEVKSEEPWKCTSITQIMELKDSENETYDYPEWLGFTTALSYYTSGDNEGKLQSITDPSGEYEFTFNYWDADYPNDGGLAGKLKEIIHPDETGLASFEYYYDGDGDPETNDPVTDGNLTVATGPEDGTTTTYVYDNELLKHMLVEVDYPCSTKAFFVFDYLYDYDNPLTQEEEEIPIVSYRTTEHGSNPGDGYEEFTITHNITSELLSGQTYEVTERWTEVTEHRAEEEEYTTKYYHSDRIGSPTSKAVYPDDTVQETEYDSYGNVTRSALHDSGNDWWLITVNRYWERDAGEENDDLALVKTEAEKGNLRRTITRKMEEEDFDPNSAYQGFSSYYAYLEDQMGGESGEEDNPDSRYAYDDEDRVILSVGPDGIESHTEYLELNEYPTRSSARPGRWRRTARRSSARSSTSTGPPRTATSGFCGR